MALRAWRETAAAELAAFTRDTLDLMLPLPIEEEAEVRRCALEIYVVDSDLDGARHMAASRHWSFWWDRGPERLRYLRRPSPVIDR
jgi:hypothetical protein